MRAKTLSIAALIAVPAALYLLWHSPARGHAEFQEPAATAPSKRTIHTDGSATVRVKPDHARVFFSVQTTAATVKETRTQNAGHVNKVMNAIKALGLADLKMKSSNVHMAPVYAKDDKKDKLPELLGYRVHHDFTVLVHEDDPAKLSAAAARILDTALENGVSNVEQVVFLKADIVAPRREALLKATQDALANARAIAAGAQETVAAVAQLDGSPEFRLSQSNLSNSILLAGDGNDTSLVAGEIEISCRIRATCVLADGKK
jgi:uncharacterized protein YggE